MNPVVNSAERPLSNPGIRAMKMDSESERLENQCENYEFSESEQGFNAQLLVRQDTLKKIRASKLDLKKETVFKMPSLINSMLSRKNEIFYFVSTSEMHVDIKDTSGSVYLPLITKQEITKNLEKLDPKIRSKISVVHLGAVKILLKSEFQEGIDSPIKMALIDNRINSRKDCILGAARGNLAYQKFMFTVYPKFGLSLQTKNLDKVLSFIHQFERKDLMNEGDKVFSITYLVGYALTNSHHSIDYKAKERIELDDIFQEIGKVEEKQFSELTPVENSWAINIAKNKPRINEQSSLGVRGNSLIIGEPSRRNTEKSLSELSDKIDEIKQQLKQIC